MSTELPNLTLEEKWITAQSNLIYFIASGITYARSQGQTAADFGTWAGQVAAPFWIEENKNPTPAYLVRRIAENKQQFVGFEMEILEDTDTGIRARMKCFGEDQIRERTLFGVSVEEYIACFGNKWEAIANALGLTYTQQYGEDWITFTVTNQ